MAFGGKRIVRVEKEAGDRRVCDSGGPGSFRRADRQIFSAGVVSRFSWGIGANISFDHYFYSRVPVIIPYVKVNEAFVYIFFDMILFHSMHVQIFLDS